MKLASPHYHRESLFESDLDKSEAERDLYRNLLRAETAIKEGARRRAQLMAGTGRTSLHLVTNCTGNCNQGRSCTCVPREMACTVGGEPTVPTRRSLPTKPRLSPWRRLVLVLTRLRASVQRTAR